METEAQKIEPMDSTESVEKKDVVVSIGDQGALQFTNQMQLGTAARLAIKMRIAPRHLIDEGLEAVMSALLMCKQFSLPNTAMNEMGYVKGKATAFGSLVTALAERHPEYGDKEEFFITKEGERISAENKNLASGIPWAHVMRVRKKGSDVWNEYFWSVDDAEKAGLLTKMTKPDAGWVKYTKDLLYHKTKARALKSNYASALNGIEYHEDIVLGNEKDVTPSSKTLNEMF